MRKIFHSHKLLYNKSTTKPKTRNSVQTHTRDIMEILMQENEPLPLARKHCLQRHGSRLAHSNFIIC